MLGGDEFALVLEELESTDESTLLAQRVLNSFATSFRLQAGQAPTSTSIGISLFPHNGEDAKSLLKCADAALYRAKSNGRETYHFYSEELHRRALRQVELETALRSAIENEEFALVYQTSGRRHFRKRDGYGSTVTLAPAQCRRRHAS